MYSTESSAANYRSQGYSEFTPAQQRVIQSLEANLRTYMLRIDTRGRTGNQTAWSTVEQP